MQALAQTDLVLIHTAGATAGQALGTHGARQLLDRATDGAPGWDGSRLARCVTVGYRPDRGRGRNTRAVADEGGWSRSQTVEDTHAHLAEIQRSKRRSRRSGASTSVDDLLALNPLARCCGVDRRARTSTATCAPQPIRFDPADLIYGNACRVPGCAMHSTQAEWWCTRHGQSRRDSLRGAVGEVQWLAAAVPFASKQANQAAQPRLAAWRFCPDRFGTYLADCDAQRGEEPAALSDSTAKEFATDLRARVSSGRPVRGVSSRSRPLAAAAPRACRPGTLRVDVTPSTATTTSYR